MSDRVCIVGAGSSGIVAAKVLKEKGIPFDGFEKGSGIGGNHYTTPFSSRLPTWIQRLGFNVILKLVRGPQEKLGVPKPKHDILAAHPTISPDLLNLVGHGKIRMKPNVEKLLGDRVHFAAGSEEEIDRIVYATGYKVSFPFFEEGFVTSEEGDEATRLKAPSSVGE